MEHEWVTAEFQGPPPKNRERVKEWIVSSPQAVCFSSHTAIFPVPKIDDLQVIPVIFFRHPIDRIASAYEFEAQQGGDNFGCVLARNTNLKGYVESRMALPRDQQCRNFQAQRFATMFGEKVGDLSVRAKKAIDELPFVGLVEDFGGSLARLEKLLKAEGFASVVLEDTKKNVSRNNLSLEAKLANIRAELGEQTWHKLLEANAVDLHLFEYLNRIKQ